MTMTRRLFSGLAAVAPAAIAKAPGLALGHAVGAGAGAGIPDSVYASIQPESNPIVEAVWKQIYRRREKESRLRGVATREAAGILDPEIQALTSCSPVYRMHLQMKKDERAESVIQKLRDRIDELERLAR